MFLEAAQNKDEQGSFMAERFRIQRHRNSDSLHLRLTGLFDEEAAILLVEELNKSRVGTARIFVHTGPLDQVSTRVRNFSEAVLLPWIDRARRSYSQGRPEKRSQEKLRAFFL